MPGNTIDVSEVIERQKLSGFLIGLVAVSWIITFFDGYDTSVKIQQGDLNPNVAFMTGKMKASGNVGKLLSLMPLTQSDDFKSLQAQLRAVSEY